MNFQNKLKILLIEDDVPLGYLIQQILEKEGYSISRAKTASEGIKEGSKNIYNLIIVDIGLPDFSGFKVIEFLKEINTDIPVIVITDQIDEKNEIESFQRSANVFHRKPLNFELLIVQIQSFFLLSNQPKSFKFKNLSFNQVALEVSSGSKHIRFTQSEFKLITLFTKYPYQVFTREDILNKILDRNKNLSDSSIDTLMSRVRYKLNLLGHKELIKTIYKLGYRLNELYTE